ncbi:MAG TPA: hypothetical protein P5092_08945 [Ruminococcus sp.]|nr:hypothetical protein [Ruminococcus sp.]
MDNRKIITSALALSIAAFCTACGNGSKSSESSIIPEETVAEATEAPTEEVTEEELIPPVPAEASDPNTVTFDDGEFFFAEAKTTDKDSAQGTLEIADFEGNPMLRFTDSGSNFADGTVQKIQIDAAKLLSPEDVAKVRSIDFDLYADATSDKLATEAEENVKAPGWIGGGGGANTTGDKWYDFAEFSGGEYNFEMSGPVHVTFKFLLAAGGICWDADMDEASFLIMRWGAQNEGNLYLDNIVFYDENGESLPIVYSNTDENAETEDTSEASEESTPEEDTAVQ